MNEPVSTCCCVHITDHLKSTVRNTQRRCERTTVIAYTSLDKQPGSTKDKENESFLLHNEYESPGASIQHLKQTKEQPSLVVSRKDYRNYSVIKVK